MSFDPKGYVSFETALSAHGVLDDLIHVIKIATAGDDRVQRIPGVGLVEWVALPNDLLFGDLPGTPLDFPGLRMASAEKALCDLVWLCESRGFAVPWESLRLDQVDRGAVEAAARRMGITISATRFAA